MEQEQLHAILSGGCVRAPTVLLGFPTEVSEQNDKSCAHNPRLGWYMSLFELENHS